MPPTPPAAPPGLCFVSQTVLCAVWPAADLKAYYAVKVCPHGPAAPALLIGGILPPPLLSQAHCVVPRANTA